jgi:hypothetical protein
MVFNMTPTPVRSRARIWRRVADSLRLTIVEMAKAFLDAHHNFAAFHNPLKIKRKPALWRSPTDEVLRG